MNDAVIAFVFTKLGAFGNVHERILDSEIVVVPRKGDTFYTLPGGKKDPEDSCLYSAISRVRSGPADNGQFFELNTE